MLFWSIELERFDTVLKIAIKNNNKLQIRTTNKQDLSHIVPWLKTILLAAYTKNIIKEF